MPTLDNSATTVISSNLKYPEGPVHCADGSIILVEINGQQLSIVAPDGGPARKLADVPGGPNGAAAGPDGDIYICNDGGFDWIPMPLPNGQKLLVTGNQPHGYSGGSLQKIDSATGELVTLYTDCADRAFPPPNQPPVWNPPFQLRGLDDLVFDEAGGVWFTDYGKQRTYDKDITAVYYATADGKSIKQMIYPLNSPNGIGLSPCGKKLYVALTFASKVVWYDIPEPGVIKPNPASLDGSHLLSADLPGQSMLDSLAVDSEGNVYVATMLPDGLNPMSNLCR
ncbi:MAG: SMP-30/gluconolactonase/LRE family protein [Arenicella sp.]|nr:SMP-30/gluconolactonase/LRE family protein [Arenicella sp.]